MKMSSLSLLFLIGFGAMASAWAGQSAHSGPPEVAESSGLSDLALARETSDPTSNLWYLFTEFSLSTTPAESFRKSNAFTLELQPSMPVSLTRSWRLLNYPELVLGSQGTRSGSQATGVKSFSWLGALSPVSNRMGFSWGLGPYVSFPVSTDEDLAPSQWQFGGGGVAAYRGENFIASAIVKSGWATSNGDKQAGSLQIQYNLQHFFSNGTQIGLGHPTIEYNWNRDGSGGWDVPIGVDVAKIFHLGAVPVKIMLEYDFTVINDSRWNPQHLIRITILPVLPCPLKGPIFE
ncbi:hypothetical protein BH10PSE11_BH10PSE11_27650 [soil metagenome]